jgi:hypothetical protein
LLKCSKPSDRHSADFLIWLKLLPVSWSAWRYQHSIVGLIINSCILNLTICAHYGLLRRTTELHLEPKLCLKCRIGRSGKICEGPEPNPEQILQPRILPQPPQQTLVFIKSWRQWTLWDLNFF